MKGLSWLCLAAALLLASVASGQTHYMRAHFINVGQGDATLLEFPCGAVLIDAGGQGPATSRRLVQYLNDFFDRRSDLDRTLETVYVTHTHIDHNRVLGTLVDPEDRGTGRNPFTVNHYVHNGVERGSGRGPAARMLRLAGGLDIEVDDIEDTEIVGLSRRTGLGTDAVDPIDCRDSDGIDPRIRILSGRIEENPGWSSEAWKGGTGNNQSLVLRVDFGDASFLFTGDLEEEAIETLVDYYHGSQALDVDLYQVGHHGSDNGTTESLMAAMSPRIAVISMGPHTHQGQWTAFAYGHPRDGAISLLRDGVSGRRRRKTVHIATAVRTFQAEPMRHAIYATGWDGTVVVHARSDGRFVVRREH